MADDVIKALACPSAVPSLAYNAAFWFGVQDVKNCADRHMQGAERGLCFLMALFTNNGIFQVSQESSCVTGLKVEADHQGAL